MGVKLTRWGNLPVMAMSMEGLVVTCMATGCDMNGHWLWK